MDPNIKPPNNYFRWIIVLCSFINHMLTVGPMLSLGVMYVQWLEDFQEGKGLTSWALSLEYSLLLGFCPVPASLASRFGFRAVAFVGALIAALGMIASVFAESISHLILFIGLTSGIGSSFCYLPSIAMVALYFDKRRSLAMGIGTMGGGVGAFIFAPFVNFLIETFAWRGALLIVGGICLNMCATGLLFRPVDAKVVEECEREIAVEITDMEEDEETMMNKQKGIFVPDVEVRLVDSSINYGDSSINYGDSSINYGDSSINYGDSKYSSDKGIFETHQPLKPFLMKNRLNVNGDQRTHASLDELGPKRNPSRHSSFPNLNQPHKRKASHETLIKSLRHIDVALLASANGFHLLKDKSETIENENFLQSHDLKQQKQDTEKSEDNRSWLARFLALSSLKTNLDMVRDKAFFLFCLSNFLTCLSYFTPLIYLVDRAVHQGIDTATGAIFISASGCGSIVGRLVTGFLSDFDCCSNRMLVYIISLCTQGIGTILSCLCGDIAILHGIYAFYFGAHMGIYTVLSPLVTIDLKGRTNIATAYGIVLFFQGTASLLGPPIAGWLFDWSRSYTWSYVTNGLFLVLSGVLVIPLLWRRHRD